MQPKVTLSNSRPFEEATDALVLFVPEKGAFEAFSSVNTQAKNALSKLIQEERFKAKVGECLTYHSSGIAAARRIILAGVGKKEECTPEAIRRAASSAANVARNASCRRISYTLPSGVPFKTDQAVEAVVSGALLGTYRFLKFKTRDEDQEQEKKIENIVVLTAANAGSKNAIDRARMFADAACFARDLVNEPANALNPAVLEEKERQAAREAGLEIKVIQADELKKMGAGAILGVGIGSITPPRLIILNYRPKKKTSRKIALVGKGITFDSGGLSLKPAKSMETMKCDMAGAAAVLSTMRMLPYLKPNAQVMGILRAAENMPSGTAIRPGDVLTAMNGKTIEVLNTDAEGRLVLADGLSWAEKNGATEIIDLATLTGACIIGLGPYIAGIMGNDAGLLQKVTSAGNAVGETFWELPIPEDYRQMLKSDIADIKNVATTGEAGAIQGAMFLSNFVDKAKWVHLDIAGPAWSDKGFHYVSKNATGFGVRTLLQHLSRV